MRIRMPVALCGLVAVVALVPLTAVTASAGAPSPVVATLTSVPVRATDAVGDGGRGVTAPQSIRGGALLTAHGKPEMLYIGAEYCPFCGAERWSMIVALSRFGTFSGLKEIRTPVSDMYPGTATWTFYGSTFTSKYITFVPVEMFSNVPTPGDFGYTTLQKLTKAQNALFEKYDAPPYVPSTAYSESYPFVDVGNKYLAIGSSYSPGVLSRLSWAQIAADLSNPSSKVAQAVDGTANYITAALCKLTHDKPAVACTSVVRGLQAKI